MNWIEFLTDNNIEFVTRGPNTRRGEVSVQCPMCGHDDPSQHLGISLISENWGCLRNMAHRGHAPYVLVAALLDCSYEQARLVVAQYSTANPDGPLTAAWLNQPVKTPHKAIVRLPSESRAIEFGGSTTRFWNYLRRRGFDPDVLCQLYGLTCCTTGKWTNRILIPITQNKELIGWQGRWIYHGGSNQAQRIPRYLSSSEEVKQSVYNADNCTGGKALFICEGPFDALNIDVYGRDVGVRATCTFGVSLTTHQIALLNEVGKRFDRVVLLFDPDAIAASYDLLDWFRPCNAVMGELPQGVKDPGDLTKKQVFQLIGGK